MQPCLLQWPTLNKDSDQHSPSMTLHMQKMLSLFLSNGYSMLLDNLYRLHVNALQQVPTNKTRDEASPMANEKEQESEGVEGEGLERETVEGERTMDDEAEADIVEDFEFSSDESDPETD